jgi:hypothetical protein
VKKLHPVPLGLVAQHDRVFKKIPAEASAAPEVDRQSTLVNAMLPLIHSLAGGLLIAAKGHSSLRCNVRNTA